jgi:hypothetical protein
MHDVTERRSAQMVISALTGTPNAEADFQHTLVDMRNTAAGSFDLPKRDLRCTFATALGAASHTGA